MPLMKTKIKNLFSFIGRAWSGGARGKLGTVLSMFGIFMFIGLFWGDVNIQRFTMNIWHLRNEQAHLATEQKTLSELEHHINLCNPTHSLIQKTSNTH